MVCGVECESVGRAGVAVLGGEWTETEDGGDGRGWRRKRKRKFGGDEEKEE